MIATDKSQSARLQKCGVSPYTADMTLSFRCDGNYELMATPFHYGCFNGADAPAWSLSRLLELLPKGMGTAVGAYPGTNRYTCFTLIDPDVEPVVADTAIEAVVQMIEQLTANGYNLNKI